MEPISLSIAGAAKLGSIILAKLGIVGATASTATAVGAVAIAAVIYISFLTFSKIVDWFRKPEVENLAYKKDNIAATIKTKIESGQHGTVKGVFVSGQQKEALVQVIYNKKTNSIEAGRTIEYDSLDSTLRDAHRENDLVIYPVN